MDCGKIEKRDYTAALGHSWDDGTLVTNATCTGEGVKQYTCSRCGETKLETIPATGHTLGDGATCLNPGTCQTCGAVLDKATGHSFQTTVTKPTCLQMGYTTYTCDRCGDSYKGDYTDATGHKLSDWITDQEPTTDSEGSKHKECENCGEAMETAPIEKLYMSATADSKGEAVVGGYLVSVTDFRSGVSPHIWTCNGESEWYAYHPTQTDYAAIRQEVAQYLEIFRERGSERDRTGELPLPPTTNLKHPGKTTPRRKRQQER